MNRLITIPVAKTKYFKYRTINTIIQIFKLLFSRLTCVTCSVALAKTEIAKITDKQQSQSPA